MSWKLKIGATILFPLAILCFCTYMYVKTGQPKNSIWMKYVAFPTLSLVPIGLYLTIYPLMQGKSNVIYAHVYTILIVILSTALWLFIAVTINVNFQFLLGGHL